MFVKVYHYYTLHSIAVWPPEWPYYFWIVALVVFLILVSILVILWKWSPKRDNNLFQVNYIEGDKISLTPDLNKKPQSNSDIDKCEKSLNIETKEETELKPIFQKTPLKLDLTPKEEHKVEKSGENVTTPLTPREIFFYDLIESANKSFNSSTKLNANRKSEPEDTHEFFIASVSPSKTCVSNVFLFVNPDDKEQSSGQEIVKDVKYL